MRAKALKDATILSPKQWPIAHMVLSWVVNHACSTLTRESWVYIVHGYMFNAPHYHTKHRICDVIELDIPSFEPCWSIF